MSTERPSAPTATTARHSLGAVLLHQRRARVVYYHVHILCFCGNMMPLFRLIDIKTCIFTSAANGCLALEYL